MAWYRIRYRRGKIEGVKVLEAQDKIDALERFRLLRLGVVVNIEESKKPISAKISGFFKAKQSISNKRVKQDDLIAILRLIGILIDAGLPITVSIKEGINTTEDKRIKYIFTSILSDLENGSSFTKSAEKFTYQLGKLTISMIRLGEETGTLANSLLKLSDILEKIQDNRRALIKATRYPLFIITAMVIAFAIVIVMVIPEFQEIFQESEVELPYPTLLLLWVEGAVERYGIYIIMIATILSIIYGYLYNKIDRIKLITDRYILKIYIIGKVTHMALLGRFIYILDVLVASGVPITKALDTAVGVVENEWMSYKLKIIKTSIEEGRSLTAGFMETGMFEGVVLQMLKAGEEGGALNKMLGKINKYYEDRYQYIIDNIATMIEPILITAIAGFVMILALGIFLPMWGLVDTI